MNKFQTCSYCDRKRPDGSPPIPCPCNQVAYCSRQCQTDHLPKHERECPIYELRPALHQKSPEVVAQILNSVPSPAVQQQQQQKLQQQQLKQLQQQQQLPQQAFEQGLASGMQRPEQAGAMKISLPVTTLLQTATKEQLVMLLTDICANCTNGAESLENIVRSLKGPRMPMSGQQVMPGVTMGGKKGAVGRASEDLDAAPSASNPPGQLSEEAIAMMKRGGASSRPNELPAFFTGVPGLPTGSLEPLEPEGQSYTEGEQSSAVTSFIDTLRTAGLEPRELKQWEEKDLREYLSMFLLRQEGAGEIWSWMQANKANW